MPVSPSNRSTLPLALLACLLLPLTSCAGSSFQNAFQPDPRLQENPVILGSSGSSPSPQATTATTLPGDFPAEIPIYPNATLESAGTGNSIASNQGTTALPTAFRWRSADPSTKVLSFYNQQFQENGWQVSSKPDDDLQGTFEARREDLQVTVVIQPAVFNQQPGGERGTEIEIRYVRGGNSPIAQADRTEGSAQTETTAPKPGNREFIGPVLPSGNAPVASEQPVASNPAATQFSDLNKVPKELRSSVTDVAQLGILSPTSAQGKNTPSTQLEPNKTITRREYARWLVAATNRFYADQPGRQIRLGVETAQPAFQDVPRTDPDFAAIQGLAEAGLIPSPLSGNSTTVSFRPDAPLTRENLILWKVPIDLRQALPNATIDAIKQTWGFQDTAKIDPIAQRAVLADFQNSDLSNIRRVFGYTTLFQPKKPVTRAEAAAALWYFGSQGEGLSAKDALKAKQTSQPAQTNQSGDNS